MPPTPGLEAMDTRGGRGGHNPYIYLAPKPPRNAVLQPWTCHFRGNAGSNYSPPSPNKFLHLMLHNKAALHSHWNFRDTGSKEKIHHISPWGCFWAGAEEESEAAAGFCVCSSMIPEEWLGVQGRGGESRLSEKCLRFKNQSVHIPSATESQSATCAGSDPATT